MNVNLNRPNELKIKALAYYQIIGGVVGLGLTIMMFIKPASTNKLLMPILTIFAGLFCFSILCGQQLIKGNLNRGLRFSLVNQMFQVLNFAFVGYSYKYIAGTLLSLGIDLTNGFNFTFNFSLSALQLDISQESETLSIGFNLIAIFLIYYIDRLRKDPELEDGVLLDTRSGAAKKQ